MLSASLCQRPTSPDWKDSMKPRLSYSQTILRRWRSEFWTKRVKLEFKLITSRKNYIPPEMRLGKISHTWPKSSRRSMMPRKRSRRTSTTLESRKVFTTRMETLLLKKTCQHHRLQRDQHQLRLSLLVRFTLKLLRQNEIQKSTQIIRAWNH